MEKKGISYLRFESGVEMLICKWAAAFCVIFPPVRISPRPNSAYGFRVRVLQPSFFQVQILRILDAVGWGVAREALQRAFPQTKK